MNEQPTNSPFHRGERDLQTRSGVRDQFATEPRILADLTVRFESILLKNSLIFRQQFLD